MSNELRVRTANGGVEVELHQQLGANMECTMTVLMPNENMNLLELQADVLDAVAKKLGERAVALRRAAEDQAKRKQQ